MSHQTLADIWMQLEGRADIDNILYDISGQLILESSLAADLDNSREASLRIVVFLKVIFDRQRTHPEGSHLLGPRQLVLAILQLVRIKVQAFGCRDALSTLSSRYRSQRCYLAQALVSGLRALWLRKRPFHSLLEQRIEEAWRGDQLTNLEKFLVRLMRRIVQDSLNASESDLSSPACGQIQLRNLSTGLYPLESRPNELLEPVRKAAREIGRETDASFSHWSRNYWILFDTAWTTEAALIQVWVDHSRSKINPKFSCPTREDFRQLSDVRKEVLRTIFESTSMDTIAKNSIAAILLTPYCGELCNCFETLSGQSGRMDTATTRLHAVTGNQPNMEIGEFLDESLQMLVHALKTRKERLQDCDGEISDLLERFDTSMDDWYCKASSIKPANRDTSLERWPSETSSISLAHNSSRVARRNAFVLDCPSLHSIPSDILRGLIEESDGKEGLQDLDNNSSWLTVHISCSQCRDENLVKSARRIDPLSEISANIMEKVFKKRPDQREWYEESSRDSHLQRSSSENASSRTGSWIASSGEKKASRRGRVASFFADHDPHTALSYRFSASGESILLFVRYDAHVIFYDIATERWEKKPASNVSRAAAGADIYAYVSKNRDAYTWSIRRRSDGELVARETIPEMAYSIACSRDDRYAAIGFASELWVCDVEDRKIHKHSLPAMKSVKLNSQQVGFSSDCKKVIIATRTSDDIVYTWSDECMRSTMQLRFPSIKIPNSTGNKDFGLSSVFSDNSSCVCLTAFTGKTYPVLLRTGRSPLYLNEHYHKRLGTQIQCAAQSPSGGGYVFVNDKNEIFSVRRESDANWHIKKMPDLNPTRKQIVSRAELMVIAMPDEATVHLFWIKGHEWFLRTIDDPLERLPRE